MLKNLIATALLAAAAIMPAAAQFRYGPAAGLNFSTLNFRQPDIVGVDQSVNPAAALKCEFMFTSFGLGLDFGIGYAMTGGFADLNRPVWQLNGFGREHVMIHNLNIPVHLRFKWSKLQGLEDFIAPIVYGGPEFNIQLAHSSAEKNGQKAFKYSGGDVALACGLGLERFKKYQITAGYSWGLTYSLKTRQLDDFSARCQGWTLRLACYF
ncbi:MAG: PorT family protein [Muribaculaceae bacterium]|nr:PorT family protein [Muribaculaceae bacterium]